MSQTASATTSIPPAGTRVRVTQYVRVGHRRWLTRVEGTVTATGYRPVGGMEMGGKAAASHQPTVRLALDDGCVTDVAVDEHTRIETLAEHA